MYNIIGVSTAPEDFLDLLDSKIPKLVLWLVSLPWWVAALLLCSLIVVCIWGIWPERELQKKQSKALDTTWELRDEFVRFREEFEEKLTTQFAALEQKVDSNHSQTGETLVTRLNEHISRHDVDVVRNDLSQLSSHFGLLSQDFGNWESTARRIEKLERQQMEILSELKKKS